MLEAQPNSAEGEQAFGRCSGLSGYRRHGSPCRPVGESAVYARGRANYQQIRTAWRAGPGRFAQDGALTQEMPVIPLVSARF